jgi:DNA-binding transcriptional regulator WhiA
LAFGSCAGEAETLERLMALRTEHPEWSFNQLATQLDTEGKTPRSGGKWHPHAVKRIVTKNRM